MPGASLLVLGLYPPSNDSAKKVCRTEKIMRAHFNDDIKGIVWNDFCVLSSNSINKIIDQSVIATWIYDRELLEDYFSRLSK